MALLKQAFAGALLAALLGTSLGSVSVLAQSQGQGQQSSGGYLTGSASRFTTQIPAQPQVAPPVARTPVYAPVTPLNGNANLFNGNVKTDEVVPPNMMRGWLDRTHPEFRMSAQANPNAVLEVKGAWDKASQILNNMGVPHREIKAKELRDVSLDGVKVLVINCEGKVPEDCQEKVRQWVIRGGYVISTDWTLHSFVEKAFPGMIAWNGGKTDGTVVDALVLNTDPTLTRGVPSARVGWKLDEESQMVKVLRPDVVTILARSMKLSQDDPNRDNNPNPNMWGILACEFPYGRGRVLHLVGHYDYNSPLSFSRNVLPDAIPGQGIGLRQAISTNFLLQGLERGARTAANH